MDFDFTSHTWTCELLCLYIEKMYGIKVYNETGISIESDNHSSWSPVGNPHT